MKTTKANKADRQRQRQMRERGIESRRERSVGEREIHYLAQHL